MTTIQFIQKNWPEAIFAKIQKEHDNTKHSIQRGFQIRLQLLSTRPKR